MRYDGKGTLSGTTIQNVPGPMFGKRMFVQASLTGTYVVKEDGTGSSNLIISLPGGFREEMKMAMVITKTEKVDGYETAREVFRADPPRAPLQRS